MVLNQTTLGELYQSLTQEEIKGLELYLQKNTVGKNNILCQLHKLMAQAKLEAMLTKLDTDYIKAELFGGDEKSVSKLTTYNNLLINHIKDYLILSKVKEKNIYTETLWGEILIERGLKRNLLLKLTTFKFDLYKDSYALMKYFLHCREKFFYQFLIMTKKNFEVMLNNQRNQLDSFNEYKNFYLLELYNSLITLTKQRNIENSLDKEKALEVAQECINNKNVLLKVQALITKLNILKDEDTYNHLKAMLENYHTEFSNESRVQLVPILLNFELERINKGNEAYKFIRYKLLCFLLENNLLFEKGIFSMVRLTNLIEYELSFGTLEKAMYLLEESLKVISPAQKDSFQYLIESRIAFAKKDYKLSLRKISIINPSDSIYYYPQYKIMLIKNYIMLADIDRLMAERENFYKYLNNQKNIQEDEKRRHKLFIKYTEYLTNARYEYLTDYMKKRIENALLQTSPYFSEKQWVRERWEELRGNS